MQFVSIDWLAWMAGTVAVFWLVPASVRQYVLALTTLTFVTFYSHESAAWLCAFTIFTYYLSNSAMPSGLRIALIIVMMVAVLGTYKVLSNETSILIPLGMSYYSFRCMSYLLERYKGSLPRHEFKDYVFYLFFLPTIIVGPIHRFPEFYKDLRRHRWNGRMISEGLERILYGYVKIAVLGNYLVSGLFSQYISTISPENISLIYYLEIVRAGLNLYFQFSGFSDIAIGFSSLLGFRVIENFNWPYLQKNISDFWRCWHISLTDLVRSYVYTSAISITRSPAIGALSSLLVIGLWHEVSVRYVAWGIYHGAGIIIWQKFQKLKPYLPKVESRPLLAMLNVISIIITVHYVWFSFVIVQQPSLGEAWHIINSVLFFWI